MNSNAPLVSVIVTTYNRADLVVETIDSILAQSYPNVELIVVDDCSSDNTSEIIKKFGDRLTYIRHEHNKGVQFASNTGYHAATGVFLCFTGDDDIWTDTEKITKQVTVFLKDTDEIYGIVTTSVRSIYPDGTSKEQHIKRPRNLVRHILKRNGIIYGSAAMLRREAFERAGLFAEDLPKGTDSDVYRRMILLGYDVYFFTESMVDYREGHTRMTTAKSPGGIRRSIRGQQYNLQQYYGYLKVYPSTLSYRYYRLGSAHLDLARVQKGSGHNKKTARRFFIQSILSNPFTYRSYIKFILTFI